MAGFYQVKLTVQFSLAQAIQVNPKTGMYTDLIFISKKTPLFLRFAPMPFFEIWYALQLELSCFTKKKAHHQKN
jgi:hypothetical protein